jgi:hypothetical protein
MMHVARLSFHSAERSEKVRELRSPIRLDANKQRLYGTVFCGSPLLARVAFEYTSIHRRVFGVWLTLLTLLLPTVAIMCRNLLEGKDCAT